MPQLSVPICLGRQGLQPKSNKRGSHGQGYEGVETLRSLSAWEGWIVLGVVSRLHLGLQPCNIAPLFEIVVETNGLGFFLYYRAPLPTYAFAEGLSGPQR